MTENEESLDKVQADELQAAPGVRESAVQQGNMIGIMGRASITLMRLVHAQEKLVALAEVDLQQTIEAEIQSRAETMANEIVEDKSKRGFIGKK